MPKDNYEKLAAAWRETPVHVFVPKYCINDEGEYFTPHAWQNSVMKAYWQHRFDTDTLVISNIKKSGKTTLNAWITMHRFLTLPGEHACAANDREQAQNRVFSMIEDMCRRNSLLASMTEFTRSEIRNIPTGAILRALPVNAKGIAGGNWLTVSSTECWGIMNPAEEEQWTELTPRPQKLHGFMPMRIADGYAGFLGRSNVWHNMLDFALEGDYV